MQRTLKHLGVSILLATLLTAPTGVQADAHSEKGDPQEKKANPTGTWTWTRQNRNGDESTSTLKLKADGEKLTGKISGRNNSENEISNGKIKGNEISFDLKLEFNDNSFTIKYAAKIEGNSLTGTRTFNRNGEDRSRDWKAKRVFGKLAGDWKHTYTRDNGETRDLVFSLKVEGEKVTGNMKVGDFELPIEGTYKDGVFAYKMEREYDGTAWTWTLKAKVSGEKLMVKSTSNRWGGVERTWDIKATRVK
jgi:hypothetical protein